MPILEIDHVGPLARPAAAAQRLADRAGEILGAGPAQCWVRLREIAVDAYAENGPPTSARPVIVRVLRFDLPQREGRASSALSLAAAIGEALDRPRESVHLVFEPSGAGRVAFGGELAPAPPRHRVQTAARWEAIVGYARAVRVGDLVWVTGTTSFDAAGEPVGVGDAYQQAAQCLVNIDRALVAVGSGIDRVVRTRMFVTDITRDWEAIGRAHAERFADVRPATTMVEVKKLIAEWMLVEIEADATT